MNFDLGALVQSAIKYLIEGLAVAVVAYYLPRKRLSLQEVLVMGVTAAATFAILDQFAPAVGTYSRTGAGFGVGVGLVGM
jgi:hypothetical protein